MSAPARAWLTAVRASSSSVASLSTAPSSRRHAAVAVVGVLAQAHVGDDQRASGSACLIARAVICTTPSSSHAPEPCSSFSAGIPNRSTAPSPSIGSFASALDRAGDRQAREVRQRYAGAGSGWGVRLGHEHRQHQLAGAQLGLAHQPAQTRGRAQSAHARVGIGHRPLRLLQPPQAHARERSEQQRQPEQVHDRDAEPGGCAVDGGVESL